MTTTPTGATGSLPIQIAGRAAAPIVRIWEQLAHSAPAPARFDPSMVIDLPEPARRWLLHAITPGTPLHRTVVLEMEGRIRLGRWLPFRAVQIHAPPFGYVWAARTGLGPISISGYDRYAEGAGEMHWRLLGRVPVITASGPDLDRSAAGRVALDALFVPTAWLGPDVTWRQGEDDDTAIGEWTVDGRTFRPQITVGPDGRLVSVTMSRWAKPGRLPWGYYPCGGTVEDEADFSGVKLPTPVRAGYFYGSDGWTQGEFLRATVTSARFL